MKRPRCARLAGSVPDSGATGDRGSEQDRGASPQRSASWRRIPTTPIAVLGLMVVAHLSPAHAQSPNLGTAASFAVLAGSTVTNTGTSVLLGNVGVSPGSAIIGFPPGIVLPPGAIHVADAPAGQAQVDLTTAYNALAGRPTTRDLTGQNLGGLTLTPGVYNFASSAQLTGNLTLNALGNPNALFIFNIGSTLTTASGSTVTVIGGGLGSNVFWRIGSSATLGTTTSFLGDILALTSITLNTGANVACGSVLARNGAVTLDTNNIAASSLSNCAAAPLLLIPPGADARINSVLAAINAAFINTGGALPQAFLNLAALTPDELNIVLPQLSGEAGTALAPAGIQAMNSFLSLVLNPFAGDQVAGNRNGFGAPPQAVRTLGFAPESPALPNLVTSYASIGGAPIGAPFDRNRWGIWAAAYGGENRTSGDLFAGTHDRTARTFGVATGFDYRVLPDTVAGFALSGGGTNYGLSDGLGGGRSDMFQAAVYSSTRFNAAYVSVALAYAFHRVSSDRWLTIAGTDHLTADFSAYDIGGRIEGGYRFAIPGAFGLWGFGFTPYAAAQVQSFHTPAYSEIAASGSAVFALGYDAHNTTAIRTELGAWFDHSTVLDSNTVLTLRARAAWAHDYVSDPTMAATFLALPGSAFIVTGASPVTDSALVSVDAWLRFARGLSIGVRFDGELADRSQTYAGTGVVRYTW